MRHAKKYLAIFTLSGMTSLVGLPLASGQSEDPGHADWSTPSPQTSGSGETAPEASTGTSGRSVDESSRTATTEPVPPTSRGTAGSTDEDAGVITDRAPATSGSCSANGESISVADRTECQRRGGTWMSTPTGTSGVGESDTTTIMPEKKENNRPGSTSSREDIDINTEQGRDAEGP